MQVDFLVFRAYNKLMHSQLSQKQIEELKRKGKLRDTIEIWVDKHNHKLELLRTLTSFIAALCSSIVLLKLFKII